MDISYDQSLSQSPLQTQSSMHGNSDLAHLQRPLHPFWGLEERLFKSRIPKAAYGKSVQSTIYFPSYSFHPHSTEDEKSWCGMLPCPHISLAMFAERKTWFINAALVGGMLSINFPLKNRSRLHVLVVTEFDVLTHKMTVNLSKLALQLLLHLSLAGYLKRENMELPHHKTSKLSTHYS